MVEHPTKEKMYILYDGRAMYDVDEASVMEAIGGREDVKRALRFWKGHDAVLVEYDIDNSHTETLGNLVNERVIGHINEGKALLSRLGK